MLIFELKIVIMGEKVTCKADVVLLSKSIVKITFHPGIQLEKEDILEINKVKRGIIKDNYHAILHICGTDTSLNKEAREVMASKKLAENQLANAIVINSLAQKIIANFFIRFNKPPEPVKIFSNEKEALKWLNTFIG